MNQGGFRGYDVEKENPPFFFRNVIIERNVYGFFQSLSGLGWSANGAASGEAPA